jgi:hypothetical protein
MTSKIKVDNINKVSDDSNIINKCGTTITLGASGDSIALASGASQTGFGRTGTVDWQTTKKTSDFTAVNGEGYFVDTGGGAVTVTLPASPSAGNIVYIKDYDANFATANCIIARNGSNIRGLASNFTLTVNNSGAALIYVDATEGWQIFADGSNDDITETFIAATGGTITCSGNCRIHTFTGPGSFAVCSVASTPANNQVSYLVVAGGGAGGDAGNRGAGGGGAGGVREDKSPTTPYTASPLEGAGTINITASSFPITVGAGGASRTSPNVGNNGNNSVFSTIISTGGGGGGGEGGPAANAVAGGSGGAGGRGSCTGSGGAGNTPPVSPPQGSAGGSGGGPTGADAAGGGGGGATGGGSNGSSNTGGTGGGGAATEINGSSTTFGGGGGGSTGPAGGGNGGAGGGGAGGGYPGPAAVAGTVNTGGGGGGATDNGGGGAGGSGIVIIRYKKS